MKRSTKFYKNTFRSEFTYADAIRMVDSNTVQSVNLSTPQDQAQANYNRLKYEDAVRRAEEMDRHQAKLRVQDAVASFIIVAITFAAMAWVISHYSH